MKLKDDFDINLIQELHERELEEENDNLNDVNPPTDVIAFVEQRSCADLFRMCDKHKIDLYVDFQRGIVWNNRAQTLFIDSLLKQLPIPSMCISYDINKDVRYVIDGLQRITTINKFLNDEEWKLTKGNDIDPRLSGKSKKEIRDMNPDIFDFIENVTIPVTVIRCDYSKNDHMQYLFQIFYRLNSGGTKLYNQEIRNCIYQGNFNTFLKKCARNELWLTINNISKDKVDKSRFRYEERILRFFAFYDDYQSYMGKLAVFLNIYMAKHRNLSPEELDKLEILFNKSLEVACKIDNISKSTNIFEAVLVGIAKNIDSLFSKDSQIINERYFSLLKEDIFEENNMKEGLGSKEKLIKRISKSIEIFKCD